MNFNIIKNKTKKMRRRSLNKIYSNIKKSPIELSKQNENKTQFLKI